MSSGRSLTRQTVPHIGVQAARFGAADLTVLPRLLGDRIYAAVLSSPKRIGEQLNPNMRLLTECAVAILPDGVYQDILLWLDVGLRNRLAIELFPEAQQQLTITQSGSRVTLEAASVSALETVFPAVLTEAINQSQLRQWERKGHVEDATACVRLTVGPGSLDHGTLCLRLAYTLCSSIIDMELYKGPER